MRDWSDDRTEEQPAEGWALKLEAAIVGAFVLYGLYAAFGPLF